MIGWRAHLARFEVDMIYLLGVPPVVLRGPGYDQAVNASGRAARWPAAETS